MSARAYERLTLENSLRNAINRDEFELCYQPHPTRRAAVFRACRW